MSGRRLWLVSEHNPYDAQYALYPLPHHASGARVARALGLDAATYLSTFERRNLLSCPKWSAPAARAAADDLLREQAHLDRLVLLGAKVSAAFGVDFRSNLFAPGSCRSATATSAAAPSSYSRTPAASPGNGTTRRRRRAAGRRSRRSGLRDQRNERQQTGMPRSRLSLITRTLTRR